MQSQAGSGLHLLSLLHHDAHGGHGVTHGETIGAGGDHVSGGVDFAEVLSIVHDPVALCGSASFGSFDEVDVLVTVEDAVSVGISGGELLTKNGHLGVLELFVLLVLLELSKGDFLLLWSAGFLPFAEASGSKFVEESYNFGVHGVCGCRLFYENQLLKISISLSKTSNQKLI